MYIVSRTFMAQSCVFLHENLRIVVNSFCRWQVSPVVHIYIWLPTKTLFSHNFTLDKPNLFFLHNLWVYPTKYSRRTVVYNMHILCYLCQNWIFYWISIPVISLLSQQDVLWIDDLIQTASHSNMRNPNWFMLMVQNIF